MKILILALITALSSLSFAWGGRGHAVICESATFLVKNKELRDFLVARQQIMGHLCNIPDIYWRNLGADVNALGGPTHFMDVEVAGMEIKDIPTDYKKIIRKHEGQKNHFKEGLIKSIPNEFGSLWWRADQFYRRATEQSSTWKKTALPANKKEEQDENLPFNKMTYDFLVNIGLMGHFVGDEGQPFHGTADYDGYNAGHGGIHGFYEDIGVNAINYDLIVKVTEEAKKLQALVDSKNKVDKEKVSFLKAKTVVEKMRALNSVTLAELPAVYAVDPVKKPSTVKKEGDKDIRTPAERESIDAVAPKFEALIIPELARSAALLAQIWDEAFEKNGQPKLASYKSYKYPLTPEFVPPDYFDLKK